MIRPLLGSHDTVATTHRLSPHLLLLNDRQTKVRHLRLEVSPQQDVVALQVAVNDPVVVALQILHSLRHLQRQLYRHTPVQRFGEVVKVICQGAVFAPFRHHTHVGWLEGRADVQHDVRVAQLG